MTHEQYNVLLDAWLEGTLSKEEETELLIYESEHPECTKQREALSDLQQELSQLGGEIPPVPADFHAAWTSRLEETDMTHTENSTPETRPEASPRKRGKFMKYLAVAAALVFLIGGTMLTRDTLPSRRMRTESGSMQNPEYAYDQGSMTTGTALYKSSSTGSAMNESAAMGDSMVFMDADEPMEYAAEEAMDDSASYEADSDNYTTEKKIIRNASLSIATKQFDDSLQALQDLCKSCGGWVASSNVSARSSGLRSAYLELRIPSDQYDNFLQQTGETGRTTSRSETAYDATESYRDTQARLKTQQALLERLTSMMTETADLSDLLELEEKIAETQYRIDSYQSSLNSTDRKVAFSSIDITLSEESEAQQVQYRDVSFGERIRIALEEGLESSVEFLQDMVLFLAGALPLIVPLILVIVLLTAGIRALRKKRKYKT